MTPLRTLVIAIVVAAVLGFAAGWYARVCAEPTLESRAHEAAETVRGRVRDLVH